MSDRHCRWEADYETIVVGQEKSDDSLSQCPEQKGWMGIVRIDRNFLCRGSKRKGELTDSTFLVSIVFISKMKGLDELQGF